MLVRLQRSDRDFFAKRKSNTFEAKDFGTSKEHKRLDKHCRKKERMKARCQFCDNEEAIMCLCLTASCLIFTIGWVTGGVVIRIKVGWITSHPGDIALAAFWSLMILMTSVACSLKSAQAS